jgi:hypothetical protein
MKEGITLSPARDAPGNGRLLKTSTLFCCVRVSPAGGAGKNGLVENVGL